MKIIRTDENYINSGSVIALGNFDGLHTAHMKIIRSASAYAEDNGLKSGIMLFEGGLKNKLITSDSYKKELLQNEKLDFLYVCEFTDEFKKLSPRAFVELLVNKFNIKAVCVGYDYTFGYKAEGNPDALKAFGQEYGFEVLVTEQMCFEGHIISSTYIRELIEAGEVKKANQLLGRHFCIQGKVLSGFQNGRKMSIPTANVEYDVNAVSPRNGVYAALTAVDGVVYKSVVNIGNNPTFNAEKITVESHILDFNGDLYGKTISVELLEYLRPDKKFESIEELKAQIKQDIETAKGIIDKEEY